MQSTKNLTDELLSIEGISHVRIEPCKELKIITGHSERKFTGQLLSL